MANLVIFTLTAKGDGREVIKDLFDQAVAQTDFGCIWKLNESVIRCNVEHGDGVTVETDAIVIKGENNWQPPLPLVMKLSEEHPKLDFEIKGFELTKFYFQRWTFKDGAGSLLDCVWELEPDKPDIVYMRDGEQFLELPEWIAVADKSMPAKPAVEIADCVPDGF